MHKNYTTTANGSNLYDDCRRMLEKHYLNTYYGKLIIPEEPEDKGTEEWIWVTGFKGTDKDMKCRDYQFEFGKKHDMPEGEPIVICSSGFHLCNELKNVFKHYKVKNGNRFFEVRALVRRYNKNGYYSFEHYDDKMSSKSIEFVRELTADEVFEALVRSDDTKFNDTLNWTKEQKELAMKTDLDSVRQSINVQKLVALGYSEPFAAFVCKRGPYDIASTIASQPGLSMDVKVMTIAMPIYD